MYKEQYAMLKKFVFIIIIVLSLISSSFAEEKKEGGRDIDKLMASVPGDAVDSGMHIFHQDIMFRYPKEWGFNPVYRNQKGNRFITEFIPKEQTLNSWKDMLTIQGFNDLSKDKDISPESMSLMLRQKFNSISPTMSYYKEIYKGDVNGYSGIIVLMGIKEMPKNINATLPKRNGEIGLYLFLKGKDDMYIIHRSWKSDFPYTDEKLPMSETELNRWINLLKQIKLI
jgi:hypothetical protein